MNRFRISGIVADVETRHTQRGTPFHIVSILDQDSRTVPIAYFGTPPHQGEEAEFKGALSSRNGYLNLEIETVRFGDRPPKVRRGARVEKPVTVPFEDDGNDALPF